MSKITPRPGQCSETPSQVWISSRRRDIFQGLGGGGQQDEDKDQRQSMRCSCGGLVFSSDFDSGNLARVAQGFPPFGYPESRGGSSSSQDRGESKSLPRRERSKTCSTDNMELTREAELDSLEKTEQSFLLWTKPDGAGTPFENNYRSWFHFGVSGAEGQRVRFSLMNLNKQLTLYSLGMRPVFRVRVDNSCLETHWERVPGPFHFWSRMKDCQFVLTWCQTLPSSPEATLYVCFTYPFSYQNCQDWLDRLDHQYGSSLDSTGERESSQIYYSRELVCRSLDGLRLELVTITDFHGIRPVRELPFNYLLPLNLGPSPVAEVRPRPHLFHAKKVVFLSGRVHPGESPSSFMLKGLVDFLLTASDPRAETLRKYFVFKVIPLLNPDGVQRGHYRSDSRGVNLNRMYLDASFSLQPTIYAARTLMLYYHAKYAVLVPHCGPHPQLSQVLTQVLRALEQRKQSRNSPTAKHICQPFIPNPTTLTTATKKKVPFTFMEICRILEQLENPMGSSQNGFFPLVQLEPGMEGPGILMDLPPLYPEQSGLACYIDFHSHASKRGCFMYGNYFEDSSLKVESMVLPKLASLNCPHFDFNACCFTLENSLRGDASKEGSGRCAIHALTGILTSYTMECNYNTGKFLNQLVPLEGGRLSSPFTSKVPPFYTPEIFQQMGKAMAISILDYASLNPHSRVPFTRFKSVKGIGDFLYRNIYTNKMKKMDRTPYKGKTKSVFTKPRRAPTIRDSGADPKLSKRYCSQKNLKIEGSSVTKKKSSTSSSPKATKKSKSQKSVKLCCRSISYSPTKAATRFPLCETIRPARLDLSRRPPLPMAAKSGRRSHNSLPPRTDHRPAAEPALCKPKAKKGSNKKGRRINKVSSMLDDSFCSISSSSSSSEKDEIMEILHVQSPSRLKKSTSLQKK